MRLEAIWELLGPRVGPEVIRASIMRLNRLQTQS